MHSSSVKWTVVTVCSQVCKKSIRRLIQNAAARLLTKTKKVDPIPPVLRSLHWLPLQQRIDFREDYISDLLIPCEASRALRWSGTGLRSVPRVKTKHGQNIFCSTSLRQSTRKLLVMKIWKTFLFADHFN